MNTTKVVHVQRTINRQLAPSYSCKDMKLPVWATEIGPEAFSENRKIETIYFPHSLKYIRHHAFRHCLHLKRIILPDGLLELGEGAFAECSDLFAAVLPASLRVLPRALFVGDMALKNVRPSSCLAQSLISVTMLSTEATRSNIWNFTMTRILSARILRIRLRSSVAMRDQRWIRTVRSMDIRRNICK